MSEVSKLYVGNLDHKITEDELKSHFEGSGIQTKSVTLIKDKYTGQAKGFGFVEVESEEVIQKEQAKKERYAQQVKTLKENLEALR